MTDVIPNVVSAWPVVHGPMADLWDGVTVAQEITRACPAVKIIALTRHDDEGFVRKMLSAGASGYVLKRRSATRASPSTCASIQPRSCP